MLCLGLEPLIRERRRGSRRAAEPPPHGRAFAGLARRGATVLAVGLCVGGARLAQASPADAERAYHTGHYREAAKEYDRAIAKRPSDAQLQYNSGAAAYKAGDFGAAQTAFERALHSDRPELQQEAYYDLGNALYRDGQKSAQLKPEQTREQWKRAIGAYESAIALDGKDADAVFNRDLVKRQLAALERQQQQQQQARNDDKKSQKSGKGQKGQSGAQSEGAQNQKGPQNQSGQGGAQPQEAQRQGGQQQPGQQGQGKGAEQAQKQGGHEQSSANAAGHDQQARNRQSGQQAQSGQSQNGQQRAQAQQENAGSSPPMGQAPSGATALGQPRQPAARGPNGERADADGEAAEPAAPGRLSRGDARQLLDSLRGDERVLPMATAGRERAATADVNHKDW